MQSKKPPNLFCGRQIVAQVVGLRVFFEPDRAEKEP